MVQWESLKLGARGNFTPPALRGINYGQGQQ
jgi:hypothetical protein